MTVQHNLNVHLHKISTAIASSFGPHIRFEGLKLVEY